MFKKSFITLLCLAVLLMFTASSAASSQPGQSGAVTGGAALGSAAESGPAGAANTTQKSEVIYANLSASGAVSEINVVNLLSLEGPGNVVDYGSYSAVKNLTDTQALENGGGAVKFAAEVGDFYYQGTLLSNELPWLFTVEYTLNGAAIEPAALSGQSGALTITIKTRQNELVDSAFYDHFMLQISLTLDSAKCRDIAAEGASIAIAGANKIVAFTALPGSDGDFVLQANVADFSMAGIEVAAMPYSMALDVDLDEMTGGLTTLSATMGQLSSGMAELQAGSASFRSGMDALGAGGAELVSGSAQIQSGLNAIAGVFTGLGELGIDFDVSSLDSLPALMTTLADTMSGVAGDVAALKASLETVDGAMNAIPYGSAGAADVEALIATLADDPAAQALVQELYGGYTAGQQAKSTYDGQKPTIDQSMATIEGLASSLEAMASQLTSMASALQTALDSGELASMLGEFIGGIAELSDGYNQFHSGLVSYTNGVSAAAAGYHELDSGIAALAGGTSQLYGGVKTLPDEIDLYMDDFGALLGGDSYEARSFTSDKNENVDVVQFVLKFEGVAAAAEAEAEPAEQQDQTLLERFFALFKKDDSAD